MVGTAHLRRPRRLKRRNVERYSAAGTISSARYYAGGDAASAASLPIDKQDACPTIGV